MIVAKETSPTVQRAGPSSGGEELSYVITTSTWAPTKGAKIKHGQQKRMSRPWDGFMLLVLVVCVGASWMASEYSFRLDTELLDEIERWWRVPNCRFPRLSGTLFRRRENERLVVFFASFARLADWEHSR